MTVPAGYSGTPLAKKLGVKDEHDLVLVAAPDGWTVPDLPIGVQVTRTRKGPVGRSDIVIMFARDPGELDQLDTLGKTIFPDGMIWVAWPRKAAGHVSDMTENAIRDAALPLGLVDVKVAALDNDWSGVKLVWRKALRH